MPLNPTNLSTIYETLTGPTNPGQSWPWSNGDEEVPHYSHIFALRDIYPE